MPPKITGIAHVELSVTDADASTAWYCRVLGAKEVWRGRNEAGGYRACAIREPETGTVLAFTQHDRIEGGPFTPARTGLDHLSFSVADEASLRAWSRHLDELGVAHDPVDDRGAVVSMTLTDPDGIALEFYHLRPRWPIALRADLCRAAADDQAPVDLPPDATSDDLTEFPDS